MTKEIKIDPNKESDVNQVSPEATGKQFDEEYRTYFSILVGILT